MVAATRRMIALANALTRSDGPFNNDLRLTPPMQSPKSPRHLALFPPWPRSIPDVLTI
jgi:hypothetical protein